MKSKHHKEIQEFIWNRKGHAFEFGQFKKKLFGYTYYGGAKFKKWLKEKYNLREFKDGRTVMLQKIPKSKKQEEP